MNFQDKTSRLDRVKSVLWLQIHLAPTRIGEADSLFSHNFPAELSAFGLNRCPQFTVSNQSDRQVKGWAAGDQKIFPGFFKAFRADFTIKLSHKVCVKTKTKEGCPQLCDIPRKRHNMKLFPYLKHCKRMRLHHPIEQGVWGMRNFFKKCHNPVENPSETREFWGDLRNLLKTEEILMVLRRTSHFWGLFEGFEESRNPVN